VKEAVAGALELPRAERAAFLEQTCPDPALHRATVQLLRACERATAGTFLDAPAAEFAASLIAEVDRRENVDVSALQSDLAGRYVIERELGRGGMATVYLARDERHGRHVALKVVHSRPAHLSGGATRFQREIEIAARLTHPHILPLHDSGTAAGVLYYIMPYVAGETLRDRLARSDALPLDVVLRVLSDVTSALAHAHRNGVVHRDIKPANILLNQDGDALVSDFGVATALAALSAPRNAEAMEPGVVLGTPAYIAPEQASGEDLTDQRADLYSLGVVAYEMLTGAPPFSGRSAHELLAAHKNVAPAPFASRRPDVPAALATLVMRLLAKRPADRPQNATELLKQIEALISSADKPGAVKPGRRATRLRRFIAPAVALLLALVVLALVALSLRDERSLAVLPFDDVSSSAGDERLGDGFTDELRRALSKVSGLRVAAASTFNPTARSLSIRTLGDTLGVTMLLQGSVISDGNQLKVTARLVSSRDSVVQWSETYERDFSDLFALQEELARDIVRALGLRGAAEPSAQLIERGTESVKAYHLYRRGTELVNTRQSEGLSNALQLFDDAIKIDSSFARAYAGMADVYLSLAIFGYERPHDVIPKARIAADRAIALDSQLVQAHAVRAHQQFVYEWDWPGADSAFRRVIDLNADYAPTRAHYGMYLHATGRHREALLQLIKARDLDALAPAGQLLLGRVYVNTHQPDQAIKSLLDVLRLNPRLSLAHQQLAHAFSQKGMHKEAIESMQRAAAIAGVRDSAQLAYIYAVSGQRAEARTIVQRLLDSGSQRYLPPFHIAMAYAGLGDADQAFRWLEEAFLQHASFMDGLAVAAGFDSIRSDPRFDDLLRRMRLR
jgi:serine/threonine-protein kinase